MVAEVALELADDRRDGERGEREAAVGVEALDRLQQGERGDLLEIVELGLAVVAPSEVAAERQEALDQACACGGIALAQVAAEQQEVGVRRREGARRGRDLSFGKGGESSQGKGVPAQGAPTANPNLSVRAARRRRRRSA